MPDRSNVRFLPGRPKDWHQDHQADLSTNAGAEHHSGHHCGANRDDAERKDGVVARRIIIIIIFFYSDHLKAIGDMAPKYMLEHFLEAELMVNITEHELVPTHVKMTDEEKAELLSR